MVNQFGRMVIERMRVVYTLTVAARGKQRPNRARRGDRHRQGAPRRVHPRSERARRSAVRGPRLPNRRRARSSRRILFGGPAAAQRARRHLRAGERRHAARRRAGRLNLRDARPSSFARSSGVRSARGQQSRNTRRRARDRRDARRSRQARRRRKLGNLFFRLAVGRIELHQLVATQNVRALAVASRPRSPVTAPPMISASASPGTTSRAAHQAHQHPRDHHALGQTRHSRQRDRAREHHQHHHHRRRNPLTQVLAEECPYRTPASGINAFKHAYITRVLAQNGSNVVRTTTTWGSRARYFQVIHARQSRER